MINWRSQIKNSVIFISIVAACLFLFWNLDRKNFNNLFNASWRIMHQDSYFKNLTYPLSPAVAQSLCLEFGIPDTDSRCGKEKVYAIDFYPAIMEYYKSVSRENRTEEKVQEKIGKYRFRAEKKNKGTVHYTWYWYDFSGDQMFPLIIIFDENGIITEIRVMSGRDS